MTDVGVGGRKSHDFDICCKYVNFLWRYRKMKKVTALLTIIFVIAASASAVPVFSEDFSGPGLDPAWTQAGYLAGHPATIAGTYDMTAIQGGSGNPKLQRFFSGATIGSYSHSIDMTLDPFGLTGGGGTQSDFKWKSFGPDGFMEIVLNSFGDMRLYHNDSDGGAGNIQPNTNIGIADGDLLNLTVNYDLGTDTLDVTYSLNGGTAISFYSGGGIDGPVGNLLTNFVEVELFKWGAAVDVPIIAIDQWNLAVPEPATLSLLLAGGLFLRRKKN
jgi:hypothetical protein